MPTPNEQKVRPFATLDALRVRLRRFQLIVGVGFFAAVCGAVLSAGLNLRLNGKLPAIHSAWVVLLLDVAVSRLWVYAVLPAFCYGLARIFSVGSWSTPIGAAATGELFYLALDWLMNSFAGLFTHPSVLIARVVTLALGIYLGHLAVRSARASVDKADAAAREAAAAKAKQYESFSAEAERIANLHASPPSSPAAEPPAPASPDESQSQEG